MKESQNTFFQEVGLEIRLLQLGKLSGSFSLNFFFPPSLQSLNWHYAPGP